MPIPIKEVNPERVAVHVARWHADCECEGRLERHNKKTAVAVTTAA